MAKRTPLIWILIAVVVFLVWRRMGSGYDQGPVIDVAGFNLGNTMYSSIAAMGAQGRDRSSGPMGIQGEGGLEGAVVSMTKSKVTMA